MEKEIESREDLIKEIERALKYVKKGLASAQKRYRRSRILNVILRPFLGMASVLTEKSGYESALRGFLAAYSILSRLLSEGFFEKFLSLEERNVLREILERFQPDDIVIYYREERYDLLMEKIEGFCKHLSQLLSNISSS